ncbi:endonuclease VII [Streptomyces sp. NPDC058861]|uniref:endonuclease VII n=1 Tax=Streptomyces sp. NPDC058861 TaxID=3346653 RepID=UPI0036AFDD40
MPMISPKLACAIFTDETRGASLPLQPEALLETKPYHLRWHGHVVIGDIALHPYKHKSLWRYDERDVRQAARTLAAVDVAQDDVVEVVLPAERLYQERASEGEEAWWRTDWRRLISGRMHDEARRKLMAEDRPYFEWNA